MKTPLGLSFLLLLCTIAVAQSLAFFQPSLEEQEIEVTTNPHDKSASNDNHDLNSSLSVVQDLLSPHLLLRHILPTQPDTFVRIRHAKVLTQPVPVYTMQQPARLNAEQLQFDMVLVRDLASHQHVRQVAVANVQASRDSWFPGYAWNPIIVAIPQQEEGNKQEEGAPTCQDGIRYQHVGWKFTAVTAAEAGDEKNDVFYALLVNVDERRVRDPIYVGGFTAAQWMVNAITV